MTPLRFLPLLWLVGILSAAGVLSAQEVSQQTSNNFSNAGMSEVPNTSLFPQVTDYANLGSTTSVLNTNTPPTKPLKQAMKPPVAVPFTPYTADNPYANENPYQNQGLPSVDLNAATNNNAGPVIASPDFIPLPAADGASSGSGGNSANNYLSNGNGGSGANSARPNYNNTTLYNNNGMNPNPSGSGGAGGNTGGPGANSGNRFSSPAGNGGAGGLPGANGAAGYNSAGYNNSANGDGANGAPTNLGGALNALFTGSESASGSDSNNDAEGWHRPPASGASHLDKTTQQSILPPFVITAASRSLDLSRIWWSPELLSIHIGRPASIGEGVSIPWRRSPTGFPAAILTARLPTIEDRQVIIKQAVSMVVIDDAWIAEGSSMVVSLRNKDGSEQILATPEDAKGLWRIRMTKGDTVEVWRWVAAGLNGCRTSLAEKLNNEELRQLLINSGEVVWRISPDNSMRKT